jgi:hypothetical protein
VNFSVQLDHQPQLVAAEVHDERAYGELPAELEALQPPVA